MSSHRLFIVRTDKSRLCLPEGRIRNDEIIRLQWTVSDLLHVSARKKVPDIRVNNLHFFVQAVKGSILFSQPDKIFLEFDKGNLSNRIFLSQKKSDYT